MISPQMRADRALRQRNAWRNVWRILSRLMGLR